MILTSLILLFRVEKRNYFLSLLLLAFSLNTLKMMLFDLGFFKTIPELTFIPFFFFLIGPSLYFYSKSLIGESIPKKSLFWHYLPFTLNSIYYLFAFCFSTDGMIDFHGSYYRKFEELFSLLSVGAYLIPSLIDLKEQQIWRQEYYSDDSIFTLNWLRNLVFATIIGWVFWLLLYILDISINYFSSFNGAEAYYPLYIYMSIFIYWIGYSGFRHKDFDVISAIQNSEDSLSIDEIAELDSIVEEVKTKRLYSQVSLKLEELAASLDLKAKHISYLLNTGLNKSFYDFINELRMEEFKTRLADPKNNNLTIQSLAEDSGFKSRSSFNDIFKKYEKITPKQYKELMQS